jgi:glycosyltransferase involved in cell wall biosynthesis
MAKRLNIVLFTRSFEIGGAEVQLSSLARGLPRDKYNVTVVCLYPVGPLIHELNTDQIRIVSFDKKGRWDIAGLLPRIVTTLRELEPDILLSFLAPPNILSLIVSRFLRRSPVIISIRASNMELSNYDWSWRFTHKIEQLLSRFAAGIVANSESGRSYSLTQGFPDPIHVIANGIDTSKFLPQKADRERLRTEWGITDENTVIALTARLDPMKDHETFLRVACGLSKTFPATRFICFGEGPSPYTKYLKDLAHELGLDGILTWAGARTDMPAIYNSIDIAMLTSRFGEGFPNTVGEAMACGVRCAVTDVGDAARIIGDVGTINSVGDVDGLISSVSRYISQSDGSREETEKKCRDRIVRNYSVPAMVQNYENLFRQYSDVRYE